MSIVDQVISRLAPFVDWFLPESIRAGSPDARRRARVVVVFTAAVALLGFPYALLYYRAGSPISAVAILAAVAAAFAIAFLMRRTGRHLLAANLATANFYAALTVMALAMGGAHAPALMWYAAIPIVAMSMAGRRSAVAWTTVAASSLAGLYALECSGYAFHDDLTPGWHKLAHVLKLIGLLVLVLILTHLYESLKDRMLNRLQREIDFAESAINSLPGIFYLIDKNGRKIRWNKNEEVITGYSAQEIPLMKSIDFVAEKDRDKAQAAIAEAFEKGAATLEADIASKDGLMTPYYFTGLRTIIDGQPYVAGTGIDISERKRAEEALRANERFLQNVFDAIQDGISILDADMNIVRVNRTIRQWYSHALPLEGKKCYEVYQQRCEPCDPCPSLRALKTGTLQSDIVSHTTPDGTRGWLELYGFPVIDGGGRAVAVVEYARNVTERRQAEEALRDNAALLKCQNLELEAHREQLQAQQRELVAANQALQEARAVAEAATRAKSEFLANMSHEIRTPMTAILGFSDVIFEDTTGCSQCDACTDCQRRARSRKAAEIIRQNGDYLLRIINDILDLSKIEAGKVVVERIPVSPCQIIAQVVSLTHMRAMAKGLQFDVEYEGAIPETISTDPTRLRQILLNVIGNAIKFTRSGGARLIVRCIAGEKPRLEFDVVDTGVGMTEQDVARLFQPFTQADASTTRRFEGTGLGLTISKRLAKMLGGDIWVVETKPDMGTRFRVTIDTGPLDDVRMLDDPLAATAITRRATDEPVGPQESETLDYRILLAEDGPDNQRLIAHFLNKAGADVSVVENGLLAVEAALEARDEGRPFDIILMDMQMPVLDGYGATRLLREKDYMGPIIALTAHAMVEDEQKCLAAGCDGYAAKPVSRRKLIETIRSRLGKQTATGQR